MEAQQVSSERAEKASPEELFEALSSDNEGLSVEEARKRLEQYGPNALEERKESPLLKFLGYFWGPIPWMIEVALILSLVVKHWLDAVIIAVLLTLLRHPGSKAADVVRHLHGHLPPITMGPVRAVFDRYDLDNIGQKGGSSTC